MTNNIKILIVANSYTAIYTDHIEKKLKALGYVVEKIDDKDLSQKYNNTAKAPSFFIVKNEKAAYMLPGKRDFNTIVKWIEDSNLI
jgi:thioredoxin-related protein